MTPLRLVRDFTPTEHRIGSGIVVGLTYAEIASELGVKPRTVRAYVEVMAKKIVGLEEMPPRWAVFAYQKFEQWRDQHRSQP